MELWRRLRRYWRDWRGHTALDDEIADELRFHLEMIADEESSQGAAPAEAAARARQRFGRVDSWQAACRDVRGIGAMDMLKQDLSFGVRMLRRAPAFTATAILTLALGMGVGTAVFSTVFAVLLKPLPYRDPHRLVTVAQSKSDGTRSSVAAANWHDWRTSTRTLAGLAAFSKWNFTIMGEPEAIRADGAIVAGPFFDVLGVSAAHGRTFTADDHAGADAEVIVISDGLWRSRFNGDPTVIGRAVRVGNGTVRVIGVMPPGFAYPAPTTDVWAPLALSPSMLADRAGEWLRTIGRLQPGVSADQAAAEFTTLAQDLATAYPDVNRNESAVVRTLHDEIVGRVRPILLLLLAAVVCLFLIASVNLGALQLARSQTRRRELAVRTALGATRLRMVRQILTESLLVALCGALFGILLGHAMLRLAVVSAPRDLPRLAEIQVEWPALCLSVIIGMLAAILSGALPVLRLLRPRLRDELAEGAHGQTLARGVVLRQMALVSLQVGFALTLLVAAGLLVRSVHALTSIDPGFDPDVMTIRVALPRSQYRTNEQQAAFFTSIVERIGSVPGVTSAGAITDLPMIGNNVSFQFVARGDEHVQPSERPLAAVRVVTPGYFATMRIRLGAGRLIEGGDRDGTLPIALINRTLAARQWGGNAVGQQLQINGDSRWLTVVGVVDDVRQLDLAEEEGRAIYVPLAQKRLAFLNWMTLVARGDTAGLAASMREAVRAVDPDQPAFDAMTMKGRIASSLATPRTAAGILSGLAVAAAAMALVGLYGTMAFLVSRRTREIGVRLALGASRRHIVRLILGRASMTVAIGLALGVAASAAASRLMVSLLYGVTAFDPTTYACAAGIFAAAAMLASYIPARRAARIDPLRTINAE